MVSAAADLLGAGNRRAGLVTLGILACGAFLLPLLLLIVFTVADGDVGSAVLGLTLGLILDLLALVLLMGVVTHKLTSRRQSTLARSLEKLATRTADLETAFQTSRDEQSETLARQTAAIAATPTAVRTAAADVGDRLQATQNLFILVPPRGPVPQMVGYVAAPDTLLVLVQKFLSLRPSLAIECGSGTSTLLLALAAQQYSIDCRLVSLEHELDYVEGTRALLADHGVSHLVDVRHAPLTPTSLADHSGPWYVPAAYADLRDIGLAFVDGPPGGCRTPGSLSDGSSAGRPTGRSVHDPARRHAAC
jgi:predicted O-methyltransferase YrrM